MKHWNKEIAKEINPQITIEITKEDVVDILSSAISGICYWGEIVPNDRQYEEAEKWLRENAESDYDDGEFCGQENCYPNWDVEEQGYVAQCHHCGKLIMLCDECMHDEGSCIKCDWTKEHNCFRAPDLYRD